MASNQEEYNTHFKERSEGIKEGPLDNSERACRDLCCLITFIVLILLLFVFGIIALANLS